MKLKNIGVLISIIFIAMIFIGSVAATDENNIDNNLTTDSSVPNLEITDDSLNNDYLSMSNDEVLSASQTITVDEVEENHNEMGSSGTIQKAIDNANDGDTVIVNGRSYVHCHFVIDKKLTIISNVGTTMETCPSNTAGSGYHGIFYISPKASGTVISGFTLKNNVLNDDDYGILVNGASDVVVKNINIDNGGFADALRIENSKNTAVENITAGSAFNAVKIKNSENINVKDSNIKDSEYGVNIIDSTRTTLTSNNISNNKISGVAVAGNSKSSTISSNNITANSQGVNLTSSNQVFILNNYIANNKNGVYVNCNVTKIEIKGNFFNQNKQYEVLNDYRVRNLLSPDKKTGYPELELINNNYMVGLEGADAERPVYRITYDYKGPNKGDYNYDSSKDIFNYVGANKGEYVSNKGAVFMGYVFEINKNVNCPVIYYTYGPSSWSLSGNYELQLSEITQVKKGLYSISITDENGNIAKDISSVPVTFYLNKNGKTALPQNGDNYKTVLMKNGTATVRFHQDEFKESGNSLTAVFPTIGVNIDDKISKTFNIDDDAIPGNISETYLTLSDLNTCPNSNQYITATLTDEFNNTISGESLKFTINSKITYAVTDNNGQAKFKVSISKQGTYTAKVEFESDETEYYSSSANSQITVKKQATKIISSNLNMIPKMAEYYSITLKDASGNIMPNQKITFKVNGKKYNKKTNSKGIAKLKLKFNKNKKTYKIYISYKGSDSYKAASKTNKIIVKYSSKTAKLSASTIKIAPKTSKSYTVSLKDSNGKGISKQKVTVKINGKTYNKKTNSKGQIKIKVKFTKTKNYKVSATYKGSKIYKKVTSKGIIKVAKTTTEINAPNMESFPNEEKQYTISLKTSAGKALSKQKVTIKINGKTYTQKTDSKGQTTIDVRYPGEKTYDVTVKYAGTAVYKSSSGSGKITVSKITTQLDSYNKTYASDAVKNYQITLKDSSNNALANQNITFTIDNQIFNQKTDENGKSSIDLGNLSKNTANIIINYDGNDKYKAVSKTNTITISNQTNVTFIDDLPNDEIQNILDNCGDNANVDFISDYYEDIALNINKPLNIYSSQRIILKGKLGTPVLNIVASNVKIANLSVIGNSSTAISINSAQNIQIIDNIISNQLNESKIQDYVDSIITMPGYGIIIQNSSDIDIVKNAISLFESGIFTKDSSKISIDDNIICENNYGITYGEGVSNTKITNNQISESTGLYIMTVPEGPTGYGIFLNNSAVNVTINHNVIEYNHIGISIDSNHSTGINITQNKISDNVLEGIRFNAGYDLASNAIEPIVTDNAIYRNARGPSMMILGELSANPEGIYGNGLYVDSDKLKLDANWYGTNNLVTWDNDSGAVGYGTMCPRISTTPIIFNNLTYNNPGNYSLIFYKNGEIADNLAEFDLYATLNRGTDKEAETNFSIIDGVGNFSFNSGNYNSDKNTIEISVGSLIDSTYRTFKITYSYNVPENEILI